MSWNHSCIPTCSTGLQRRRQKEKLEYFYVYIFSKSIWFFKFIKQESSTVWPFFWCFISESQGFSVAFRCRQEPEGILKMKTFRKRRRCQSEPNAETRGFLFYLRIKHNISTSNSNKNKTKVTRPTLKPPDTSAGWTRSQWFSTWLRCRGGRIIVESSYNKILRQVVYLYN